MECSGWPPDAEAAVPLEILALAGHTPGQCGLRAGAVVFSGDALFASQTWEKHGFVYFADVGASLAAIDALVEMRTTTWREPRCRPI